MVLTHCHMSHMGWFYLVEIESSLQVYRAVFHHPQLHLGSFTVCAFTFWNKNLATRPERVL